MASSSPAAASAAAALAACSATADSSSATPRLGGLGGRGARAPIGQLALELGRACPGLGQLLPDRLELGRDRRRLALALGLRGDLHLELGDPCLGRIHRARPLAHGRELLLHLLELGRGRAGGRGALGLLGELLLQRGDALLGRVGGRGAGACGRQLALQLLEQLARLVPLLLGGLELGCHLGARRRLLSQPGELLARRGELLGDRAGRGLAALGLRLELREAGDGLGGRGDLRLGLLQARPLRLELAAELLAGRTRDLELARELLGARRRLVQLCDLLGERRLVGDVALERLHLPARLLQLLAQLGLARLALLVGRMLARRQLALECPRPAPRARSPARRPARPRPVQPRARHAGARAARRRPQRRPRRPAPRSEAVDLGLQLALAQVCELAVDNVLEARAQLQQLDLVDGDPALDLGQLLGIGGLGLLAARLGARGRDRLELALAIRELGAEALDLDAELVHERRILEHALGDLAPVALALDVAHQLLDAHLLPLHGLPQLHRRGSLLGEPLPPVRVLELGDGPLALLQDLQALFELQLQLVEDALALLLDALLDGLVLGPSERSAQAAARPGPGGLVETILESAVMGVACDGAVPRSRLLSTDVGSA